MSDGKRGCGGWTAAGFGVLTLLVLYVGAYYALVQPMPVLTAYISQPPEEMIDTYGPASCWRFHSVTRPLFWPIHRIDQMIRPGTWEVP